MFLIRPCIGLEGTGYAPGPSLQWRPRLNAPQPSPQRVTRAAALRALGFDSPVLAEPLTDLLSVAACALAAPVALLLVPKDARLAAAARFGADAPEESGEG